MKNHSAFLPSRLAAFLSMICLGLLAAIPLAQADVAQDYERAATAHRHGDYQNAVKLWQPLAEKGVVNAQFNLGQMFRYGDGVAQNYAEALKWYRKAAEQGDKESQLILGLMYLNAEGVERNEVEAQRWFTMNRKQHSHRDHAQYRAWVQQAVAMAGEAERRAAYEASRRNGDKVLADLRARAGLPQMDADKNLLAMER
ncbi:MAG TPA: tetratricopeptide repeat protein [Sulfuricella sp.]|nr:tetratricopeptide repeat protein [Sulfuricella sp.]